MAILSKTYLVSSAVALVFSLPAAAQTTSSTGGNSSEQALPPGNAAASGQVPSPSTAAPAGESAGGGNPFERYDRLSLKGWITPFPAVGDTILRDKLGIRPALADAGIGILGLSVNNATYNVAGDNLPNRPRIYNGQDFTYNTGIQALFVTFDAAKLGIDGGQFFASGTLLVNGLQAVNGPREARFTALGYYQELAQGAVAIKIGYFDSAQEFVGSSVGGSVATGSLGPQARIPVQTGLSVSGYGTPGITLRLNGSNNLYTKVGVMRSLAPGGFVPEKSANEFGLDFKVKGAKALYVGEVGQNQASAPGIKQSWFRAGGMYNTSDYTRFSDGTETENWSVYAAYDRQFTQPSQILPFQGFYGGVTFNYAPTSQNLYSQYYEGRVYGIGLIPGRPLDLASVVATYNKLSNRGVSALVPQGGGKNDSTSVIASYAYRAYPGVYLQPGIGVVDHPTFLPRAPTAVNIYFGINFIL